jgi:hypothetical protein
MADLSLAVQTAIVAKLQAGVTLAPVYTIVPDNTQPPVVVVTDSTWEQVGGKGGDAERHDFAIRTMVGGTSKAALFALMQEVKAALHDQPLTSTVAALSRCVMISGNELRDIDENTLIGEQRFFVYASPL